MCVFVFDVSNRYLNEFEYKSNFAFSGFWHYWPNFSNWLMIMNYTKGKIFKNEKYRWKDRWKKETQVMTSWGCGLISGLMRAVPKLSSLRFWICLDSGKISVLVLLDLCAACDMVDHAKLGRTLRHSPKMVKTLASALELLLCLTPTMPSKQTNTMQGVPEG